MKTHYLPLVVLSCVVPTIFAAEIPSPIAARLTSPLADGTPPTPAPEKPKFIVRSESIISSDTREQGGRQITVQQIPPIALPPPPEVHSPRELTPAVRELMEQRRQQFPRQELISLSATVYRSKNSPSRTLVTYWQHGDISDKGVAYTPVTFWSSADFSLLTSFSSFDGSDGKPRSLFMTWGIQDNDHMSAWLAQNGRVYKAPKSPAFPAGAGAFKIITGQPTSETLASIQALHDLYNNEYPKLKDAYDGREKAQLLAAAEAKAHPPQPKNLTLNYWRMPPTAPASPVNGGAQ